MMTLAPLSRPVFFIMHLICTFSKYYGHLLQFYVCCFYLNSGFNDAFNDVSFSFCSLAPPVARIIHPSLLALSLSLSLCVSVSQPHTSSPSLLQQQLLLRHGELVEAQQQRRLSPPRSDGCWMYHAVPAALGSSVPPPPHRLLPAVLGRPTR